MKNFFKNQIFPRNDCITIDIQGVNKRMDPLDQIACLKTIPKQFLKSWALRWQNKSKVAYLGWGGSAQWLNLTNYRVLLDLTIKICISWIFTTILPILWYKKYLPKNLVSSHLLLKKNLILSFHTIIIQNYL